MNINLDRLRELIVKEVDELTTSEEKIELKNLLKKNPKSIQELNEQKKLKELSNKMRLKSPSQEVFDSYWTGVYNRIERGVGWIIFSIGAVILITYGLFKLTETLINDPQLETIIKIGTIGVIAGIVIIFVSIIREKLTIHKTDKYKEVQR